MWNKQYLCFTQDQENSLNNGKDLVVRYRNDHRTLTKTKKKHYILNLKINCK